MKFCDLHGNISSRSSALSTRIIGGIKPIEPSWSWLVRLQFQDFSSFKKGNIPSGLPCGGTLLNADWLLTAGHCCDRKYLAEIHFKEKFDCHVKIKQNEYFGSESGTQVLNPIYGTNFLLTFSFHYRNIVKLAS